MAKTDFSRAIFNLQKNHPKSKGKGEAVLRPFLSPLSDPEKETNYHPFKGEIVE